MGEAVRETEGAAPTVFQVQRLPARIAPIWRPPAPLTCEGHPDSRLGLLVGRTSTSFGREVHRWMGYGPPSRRDSWRESRHRMGRPTPIGATIGGKWWQLANAPTVVSHWSARACLKSAAQVAARRAQASCRSLGIHFVTMPGERSAEQAGLEQRHSSRPTWALSAGTSSSRETTEVGMNRDPLLPSVVAHLGPAQGRYAHSLLVVPALKSGRGRNS
jgi:hypothetical protein